MKYFEIIDKNVAAIFLLQWKIGNISDIFLQYSVLCGPSFGHHTKTLALSFWTYSFRRVPNHQEPEQHLEKIHWDGGNSWKNNKPN